MVYAIFDIILAEWIDIYAIEIDAFLGLIQYCEDTGREPCEFTIIKRPRYVLYS